MLYNTNNIDIKCPKCNYSCKIPSQLKKHFTRNSNCKMTNEDIEKYFQNIYKGKNNDDNKQKILTCIYCYKVFANKSSLVKHNKMSKCGKAHTNIIQDHTGNNAITGSENQINQQNINGSNISVINNNNCNNIINNYIVEHLIVPSGFEMIPKNIPVEDIKKYLLEGRNGIDKVFKMTFENQANNNFFFRNSNKKNISYLSQNYTLEICQNNEMINKLQNKYIELLYGMYAECANMLDIQEKVKIFELIQEMDKIKPTDTNIDNQIRNLFSKSSNKYKQDIAKKIQSQITMLNTNAEYKTAALEYCNKYLDYVKYIENIHEIECKSKISLRFIISKLGNPLIHNNLVDEIIYNDFLLNYYENTFYYKYWNKRIQDEKQLILNIPNIKVQDIRDLNIRTLSIHHALTLMFQKYNKVHDTQNTPLTQDTFIAIMPEVYLNYTQDDDIANLNNFE
jgi:hypothetical protein